MKAKEMVDPRKVKALEEQVKKYEFQLKRVQEEKEKYILRVQAELQQHIKEKDYLRFTCF